MLFCPCKNEAPRRRAPEEVFGLGCEEAAEALCPFSARKRGAYGQDALHPLRHLATPVEMTPCPVQHSPEYGGLLHGLD